MPARISGIFPSDCLEPPADWGPISINLEEIVYPHPVEFLNLNLYGQDVSVHGRYYGWYWKAQIEALRNEGFLVVVKDRLGWGRSSKPILPYSMNLHASKNVGHNPHLEIPEVLSAELIRFLSSDPEAPAAEGW